MTSTATLTAKAIRAELKVTFPNVKFSVTSQTYSGGNSVNISYIDFLTIEQIELITDKYQFGNFNSQEDLYEYSNCIKDLPQVKYVFVDRSASEATKQILFDVLAKRHEGFTTDGYNAFEGVPGHILLHREFYKTSF
jgi:hypothetical protein